MHGVSIIKDEKSFMLPQIPLLLDFSNPPNRHSWFFASPLFPSYIFAMRTGSGDAPAQSSESFQVPEIREDMASQPHICSFCNKAFQTLQSLGGHQTSHRREIKEMRKQHEAFMEAQRLSPRPLRASSGSPGIHMVPLTPNPAYWDALRKAHQSPVVINFIDIHSPEVSQQHPQPCQMYKMASSSEETITDPMLTLWRDVDRGEEVNSVNPDVTLKL